MNMKSDTDTSSIVEVRRFVARLGKNAISVYEAPDMGLLDKKSFKLDGVQVILVAAMPLLIQETDVLQHFKPSSLRYPGSCNKERMLAAYAQFLGGQDALNSMSACAS